MLASLMKYLWCDCLNFYGSRPFIMKMIANGIYGFEKFSQNDVQFAIWNQNFIVNKKMQPKF